MTSWNFFNLKFVLKNIRFSLRNTLQSYYLCRSLGEMGEWLKPLVC